MARLKHLDAYHHAIELAKKAGFVLSHVARTSETCYYYHPAVGTRKLLRLSTHKSKHVPIGMNAVVARASFTPKDNNHTPTNVYNKIAWAIGRYFLEEPKPSEYKGKRGTWEQRKEDANTSID